MNIAAEIAQLRAFSRSQLLEKWRKLYGGAAPSNIRRELLIPFLAYRMQEKAYGGLKPSTCAELRRIARGLENNSRSTMPVLQARIKPGTRIARHWRGKPHEVLVTEAGFEYCGKGYDSLSQIAREITGTRWSGPAFFGLRKRTPARGRSSE